MFIHELRTPISTISMGLSILEKEVQSNESKNIIKDLNESVVFIENIFSKFIVIQDGNIKLNTFEPFSLDDLLQNVINLLNFHIQLEDVWLEYKIHSDVADLNYGDKYNIKHCIINVVKNAIKYRKESCKSFITIDVKHVNDPKLKLHLTKSCCVLDKKDDIYNVPNIPLIASENNISNQIITKKDELRKFSICLENPGDNNNLNFMKSMKPKIPLSIPSYNKPIHAGRNIISNQKQNNSDTLIDNNHPHIPASSAINVCLGHSNPGLPVGTQEARPSWSTKYETIPEHIRRKRQTIQIIICDNNDHILPHIKKHLFESFNSTSGSGLGLYICKNIIELHGGTIVHEFIKPIGNQFTITLPLVLSNEKL
jgi:signal transduction histidine kinase